MMFLEEVLLYWQELGPHAGGCIVRDAPQLVRHALIRIMAQVND